MHDSASWFRKTWFTRRRVRELKNAHNSVTVQNQTHVYMNFFHHKDLGNHLLQLCPKVVEHPILKIFMLQTEINLISCKYQKLYDHPLCATCHAPQLYTCTQCFIYTRASTFQDHEKKLSYKCINMLTGKRNMFMYEA